MSVCLFVYPFAYLENHADKFHPIFRTCYPQPWLGTCRFVFSPEYLHFLIPALIISSAPDPKQTDKQTYRHVDSHTSHPYRGRSNKTNVQVRSDTLRQRTRAVVSQCADYAVKKLLTHSLTGKQVSNCSIIISPTLWDIRCLLSRNLFASSSAGTTFPSTNRKIIRIRIIY